MRKTERELLQLIEVNVQVKEREKVKAAGEATIELGQGHHRTYRRYINDATLHCLRALTSSLFCIPIW